MSEVLECKQTLERGQALAELCRTYEIAPEWLESSDDLDQLLARVLVDCERRLHEITETAPEPQRSAEHVDFEGDGMRRLRDLVCFAREAAALRSCAEGTVSLVHQVEDLERIRCGNTGSGRHDAVWVTERALELCSEIARLCHKINNPLTSLMGRAQMLRMMPAVAPDKLAKASEVIEESARRVAGVVQELAQVAGRGKEELLRK